MSFLYAPSLTSPQDNVSHGQAVDEYQNGVKRAGGDSQDRTKGS
jgi:hypothetical protein